MPSADLQNNGNAVNFFGATLNAGLAGARLKSRVDRRARIARARSIKGGRSSRRAELRLSGERVESFLNSSSTPLALSSTQDPSTQLAADSSSTAEVSWDAGDGVEQRGSQPRLTPESTGNFELVE